MRRTPSACAFTECIHGGYTSDNATHGGHMTQDAIMLRVWIAAITGATLGTLLGVLLIKAVL